MEEADDDDDFEPRRGAADVPAYDTGRRVRQEIVENFFS